MKKVLFGLLALAVVIGGLGYGWYKSSYGGTERYVKITQDGSEKLEKAIQANAWCLMSTSYLLMIKWRRKRYFLYSYTQFT